MDSSMVLIATDCVCDLPEELKQRFQIPMMHYYIHTEEARFRDNTEILSSDLLEYIGKDGKRAYSSSAEAEEYRNFWEQLREKNKNPIIHICMADKVSAAFSTASKAAEDLEEVYVVDSGHVSAGMGIMVLTAAWMARQGATCEVILAQLEQQKSRVSTSFVLNSTECLCRNGRINKRMSAFWDFFKLHPVLKLKDSMMKPVGIVIGNRNYFARSYIRRTLRRREKIVTDIVFLITAGCSYEYQEFLKKEISKDIKWKQIVVNEASATVACNCGAGAFGVLFLRKE